MSMENMVIKRNGQTEPFDCNKIYNAVKNAFKSCGYDDIDPEVEMDLKFTKNTEYGSTVEEIQDTVEKILFNSSYPDVYKHYVTYRANHALMREIKTKTLFDSIIGVEKNSVTRENGNMNSDTPAGMMMKFASETTKTFSDRYILSPDVRKAATDNYIHIHDKDYYLTRSLTCLQHPLDKILTQGFQSGHGSARPAKRIETAAIQACISMETIQNEMHGGQAIPAFDFYMAPYVRATYIEEVNKIRDLFICEEVGDYWDNIRNAKIEDYEIKELPLDWVGRDLDAPGRERIKQMAINSTVKRVHQAMESFIHNMNSIHSRGGNQVVFSSINYGTDTSAEGRCVIRELLKTTERGVGNNATAIFPIQIWKMKAGVSVNPGDPNYDLYKYSLKVAARRFFPNYLNLDSSFNKDDAWNENDPRRFEHEVATMGALAGHEHLYIKIGDGEPMDISIKDLFDLCKNNLDIIGRPSQIWYNKDKMNNTLDPLNRIKQSKSNIPNQAGVYSITYLPEDVTYIGSSSSLSRRVAEHKCNIRKTGGIDAGAYFGDSNLENYEFKILEISDDYKNLEKKYIETIPNINFKGTKNKFYKNITQAYKNRIYNRPNFRQNLSFKQDLIDLYKLDIKVLDRDNKWVKIKHIFKNDKHNSPFMMHIFYKENDTELCLTCTEDHPLWNGNNFVRADNLKVGDKIYRADNKELEITDISWHWCTVDSYDIGTETGSFIGSDIIMHNCRTRVYENRFGPKTSVGRGNLSFTTINFPKLAIEVSIEDGYLIKIDNGYVHNDDKNRPEDQERRLSKFMDKCYEMVHLVAMQLDERYQFQKQALAKQFPLLMKGMWNGSENLKPEDTIESVINQGTLGIGFIGLAEALVALTGKHHAEDPNMQSFGLALIENLKIEANNMSEQYKHNYSILATPAEGLSGKFTDRDRKLFGVIPGVTDRDYYTNSNHVPVYYKCTASHKAEIECPYHKNTLGGHIFYVESDYDPTKNPEAIDVINRIARDFDGGYISFNHNQGRCNHCNYESDDPNLVMGSTCPNCHTEGSWDQLSRITGYLISTTDRWNDGKMAELKDRVIHN